MPILVRGWLLGVVSLFAACSSCSGSEAPARAHANADCARLVPDDTFAAMGASWRREQWSGSTCVLGPDVTREATGERFVNVWLYCDVREPSVEHLAGSAYAGLGRSAKRDESNANVVGIYFVASRARCRVEVTGRGVPAGHVEAIARSVDAHLGPEAELR